MTPEQLAYLDSRRRQIRYWPWLAGGIVTLVAGFYAWLWAVAPMNLNTALVLQQFHSKLLSYEELVMLAARGTLALIACGLFVLVLVLLVSVALWNEARLLRLLEATGATAAPAGPAPAMPDAGEGVAAADTAPGADLPSVDADAPAGDDTPAAR